MLSNREGGLKDSGWNPPSIPSCLHPCGQASNQPVPQHTRGLPVRRMVHEVMSNTVCSCLFLEADGRKTCSVGISVTHQNRVG